MGFGGTGTDLPERFIVGRGFGNHIHHRIRGDEVGVSECPESRLELGASKSADLICLRMGSHSDTRMQIWNDDHMHPD